MYKRGIVAGVVLVIVGFAINMLMGMLIPSVASEYQNTAIFRSWDDPLMMVYFAYPFILGVVLSYLWKVVKEKDPMEFARLYFIIATIPGMFITWTSMQISALMIAVWMIVGFLQAYIAGLVFSKVK